jgi:NAD(P)-dependent dehydrogenase (short-subunit alcohol dehydrogenase family)
MNEFGRLDVVIANAGIASAGAKAGYDELEFQRVIDVNLLGAWRTVKIAAPAIISGGRGGSIVMISSIAGMRAVGVDTSAGEAYVASKHAVVGLMRNFAKSLAPHGIRVNSLHPTFVRTPMVVNAATEGGRAVGSRPISGDNLLSVDLIDPVDVSNAVLWLVSDEARYVTGVTLPVDAGNLVN